MGQGGAVLDLTDYGAKAVRTYAPGPSGRLVEQRLMPESVVECEKSGELSEVWKMEAIRRPRATGCAFTRTDLDGSLQKVTHLLDAQNRWTTFKSFGGTNATTKIEVKLGR